MNRKEFLAQVSFGAAALLAAQCGIGCNKSTNASQVDFTLDISTGPLSGSGGYLIKNGVIVAKTAAGDFIAVSAACPHEGTSVNYNAAGNAFVCPNHGATFSAAGAVTRGPANSNLIKYNTALSGTTLRVYS